MSIKRLFQTKKLVVSCEIFPPKPDYPVESIFATLESLSALQPDFIKTRHLRVPCFLCRTAASRRRVPA